MMKCIVNGRILLPDSVIDGKVLCFDRKIEDISAKPVPDAEIIDARGCYVAPGLIDVHCHGCMGYDTANASVSDLEAISACVVKHGVTGWLPTTATLSWPTLEQCFTAIRKAMRKSASADWNGARILGCHAEGPFINPKRKGAQWEQYIQRPDIRKVKPWADVIRLMTVAPEVEGALDFIRAARRLGILISMGHSDATSDQALAGIEAGATHVTHTFNAMPPLSHRNPGLLGAAMNDERVYCELIADTVHVNTLLFPIMVKLKPQRLVLVTDSIQCAGLPKGAYDIMGNEIVVEDTHCRLSDGTIAGSTLTMDRALRNFIQYSGTTIWRAVNMASLHPARAIGVDNRKGSLQRGKDADIIITDRNFNVRATYVEGRRVYPA